MNLYKYNDKELINKLNESKAFCDDLKRALEFVPETSILGRLGISASLKNESKKYDKLLDEAKRRGLR